MTTREERRRTHHLNRALKHCPGRKDIEDLRGIGIYLREKIYLGKGRPGEADIAEIIDRAVEVLLDLRVAAHGGKRMPPNRHWEDE